MTVKKVIAILAILVATSTFATGTNDITSIVEKINITTNQDERSVLIKQLDHKLDTMDRKDLPRAQEIINNKLNQKAIKKAG